MDVIITTNLVCVLFGPSIPTSSFFVSLVQTSIHYYFLCRAHSESGLILLSIILGHCGSQLCLFSTYFTDNIESKKGKLISKRYLGLGKGR